MVRERHNSSVSNNIAMYVMVCVTSSHGVCVCVCVGICVEGRVRIFMNDLESIIASLQLNIICIVVRRREKWKKREKERERMENAFSVLL